MRGAMIPFKHGNNCNNSGLTLCNRDTVEFLFLIENASANSGSASAPLRFTVKSDPEAGAVKLGGVCFGVPARQCLLNVFSS